MHKTSFNMVSNNVQFISSNNTIIIQTTFKRSCLYFFPVEFIQWLQLLLNFKYLQYDTPQTFGQVYHGGWEESTFKCHIAPIFLLSSVTLHHIYSKPLYFTLTKVYIIHSIKLFSPTVFCSGNVDSQSQVVNWQELFSSAHIANTKN